MSNRNNLVRSWGGHGAAGLGGLIFLAQSFAAAHTQSSVLDEGLYLVKGLLFANGTYTPFQDFGPWTNHMPLSFLIPGWVQVLLGPGLRTGRYFAVFLSILTLIGLWTLVRRVSRPTGTGGARQQGDPSTWWGALAVWAVALNPALIKIYSVQASQGLIACLLIWSLVLVIGPGRPRWQLVCGAALAGAIPLTRINMLPVLPFILGYVFWEHGKRRGSESLAAGLGVFLLLHALYWPGILRMWAPWLPAEFTPFLDSFRRAPGISPSWSPSVSPLSRLMSALQGFRFHFIALTGVFGTLIFWPKQSGWRNQPKWRSVASLTGLFLVLLLAHAWAALGQNYCVFCFPVYLSFFSLIGLIIVAASVPYWGSEKFSNRWVLISLVLMAAAVGFGSFDTLGAALIQQPAVLKLLRIGVPRTTGSGTIPLWGLIENTTGLDYVAIVRETQYWGRIGISTLIGSLAGIGLVWGAYRLPGDPKLLGARAVIVFLAAGLILSPSAALGGAYRTYDCSGDVITAYETAGADLKTKIKPEDQVYWSTGKSPAILLYLPGIGIYPSQLNGVYSFKIGGEPEALERFGHWNQALAERWALEADVILIDGEGEKNNSLDWLMSIINSSDFRNQGKTNPVHPCNRDSQITVFVRESD